MRAQVGVSNNHLVNVCHIAWELHAAGQSVSFTHVASIAPAEPAEPAGAGSGGLERGAAAGPAAAAASAGGGGGSEGVVGAPSDAWTRLCARVGGVGVLVGPDYYASKQRMLDAEQVLMRALRFHLHVEQPHALLFNLAAELHVPGALLDAAAAILSDAWCFSTACRRFEPLVLAVSALELARDALQVELRTLAALQAAQQQQDAAARMQPGVRQRLGDAPGARRSLGDGAGREGAAASGAEGGGVQRGQQSALQGMHWCEVFGVERAQCQSCMRLCMDAVQHAAS